MSEHETPKKDATDFEAAQTIVTILRDRDKGEQERILRWVSESLQLSSLVLGAPTSHPTPIPHAPSTEPSSQLTTINIKSFVAQKQPKSDVQFAAVVAYFYQFEAREAERKAAIEASDLQEAARLADWKRFRKPYVPLQNAANQGYLDRAGGGAFRINAVGENLVAMALPGGSDEASGNRTRRKARKAKAPRKGKKKVERGQRKAKAPSTGKKKVKRSQFSKSK